MTQIKIFHEHTYKIEDVENKVNQFIKENDGKIVIRDIKYTTVNPNLRNHIWQIWNVMVMYDTV